MEGVYAWVGVDPSGEEYIIGADLGFGPMPFVTSMETLIQKMRPIATKHGRDYKVTVKLVKFSTRDVLETL